MKPRLVRSVNLCVLLSWALWLSTCILVAHREIRAAPIAPSWKSVRVIGGSPNWILSKVNIASNSNLVYVAVSMSGGTIEGSVTLPSSWNTALSIYDAQGQNLLSQLQPKASQDNASLAVNNLAPLNDGSMLYASMDDAFSSIILQKWDGTTSASVATKFIQGRASGDLPKLFTAAFSDGGGGFIFAGSFSTLTVGESSFQSLSSDQPDAFVISFGGQGNVRWIKNGVGIDLEKILAGCWSASDDSIYVGGYTTSPKMALGTVILDNPATTETPFIAKYKNSGEVEWVLNLKSNSLVQVCSLGAMPDGDIVCLGKGPRDGNWVANLQLLKISNKGVIRWIKPAGRAYTFATLATTVPTMKLDRAGRIFVAFNFNETTVINGVAYRPMGGQDVLLAQFNQDGAPVWVKTAGFIGDDYVTDLAISPDSRVYLTGSINSKGLFDDNLVEGTYGHTIFLAELQSEFSELPQISTEPESQNVFTGRAVTLEVIVAKPSDSSYQWYFNGLPLSGATNSTYLIANATAADQGSYFVEVRNAHGTIRSKAAQVRIDGQLEVKVSTHAGGHGPGYVDSTQPQEVQFHRPNGLAYFSQGLIAVADEFNHVIRLVGPGGATDTYAGNHEPGLLDAPAGLASFLSPIGLTVTPALDVLVADFRNDRIRRISAFGWRTVSTSAGSSRGYADGPSDQALLNAPNDLVTDSSGHVYFTEFNNHTVRKLSTDGLVTTLAGNGLRGGADGVGKSAQFDHPGGLTIDRSGNIYVTEYSGQRVRKITPSGVVTTIAGSGTRGFLDGEGSNAQFNAPDGITVDPVGNLYVCEGGNHSIRKIDPLGNVVTVAGLGRAGYLDGNASTALFNSPGGIMWHPAGGLVVADTENHALRRITFSELAEASDEAQLLITLNPALTIFGKPGASYRIEASENPGVAAEWVTLDTVTLVNGVGLWCDSQPATRKERYYRAVRIPQP